MFRNPIHAAFIRQKAEQKFGNYDETMEEEKGFTGYKGVNQSLKHLKLSFPMFKEGSDPVEWLRDCEEYFSIYEVEDKRRAAIAAMHLTGVPRSWYKSFTLGNTTATWSQFSQAFLARFGELDTELVFDRFKRLQQVTTVEAYYDEFEKCRGQLLSKIPSLTNEYFLENFIGGLQTEIKGMIRLLEPSSLEQALKLARFYEHTVVPSSKKYYSGGDSNKSGFSKQNQSKTPTGTTQAGVAGKLAMLTAEKPMEITNATPRPLTYAQREERRKKGLCFYCDENFIKGHECK